MTKEQLSTLVCLLMVFPAVLDAGPSNRRDTTRADVIVYGSTPGGFCAAIAAAREGASVILLEPTGHVGAMNTGGLSHCDSNQMVRSTVMGLFDEWHNRVVKDYTDRGLNAPYNPAKKDHARWTFEPHVAMRVTMRMLEEAGVLAAPGSDFCPDSGQHYVRFSYAGETTDVDEALDRIERWRGSV